MDYQIGWQWFDSILFETCSVIWPCKWKQIEKHVTVADAEIACHHVLQMIHKGKELHTQTTDSSAPIAALLLYLRFWCVCSLFLYSLPFPEDQFSFPLQERGGQRRGGAFRGPTLRPKGHSGFKCAPCVAGAAIALMQSDRDRCDISVPTHFHTTSHRLGVTHIPLLWSCPPAAGQHDDARMNLAIALTAARYGAAIANYTEVVHLLKRADPQTGKERVCGAHCRDVITGKSTKAASFLPASLSIPHNRGPPSTSYSVLVCT